MVAGGLGVTVLPASAVGAGRYALACCLTDPLPTHRCTARSPWPGAPASPAGAITALVQVLKSLAQQLNAAPLSDD